MCDAEVNRFLPRNSSLFACEVKGCVETPQRGQRPGSLRAKAKMKTGETPLSPSPGGRGSGRGAPSSAQRITRSHVFSTAHPSLLPSGGEGTGGGERHQTAER